MGICASKANASSDAAGDAAAARPALASLQHEEVPKVETTIEERRYYEVLGAIRQGIAEAVEAQLDTTHEAVRILGMCDRVNGNTLLHEACALGHGHIVELLLAKGARANLVNKAGDNALWVCFQNGHLHVALVLIAAGHINTQDRSGRTALVKSAAEGALANVSFLLEKGAKPNAKGADGLSALHAAYAGEHQHVVQALLAHEGVDANSTDPDGNTLLHLAATSKSRDRVSHYVHRGMDVNAVNNAGDTPAFVALKADNWVQVGALLPDEADLARTDVQRRTYLHWCAQRGYDKLVEWLLNSVCGVEFAGEEKTIGAFTGDAPVFLNAQDATGATALVLAAREGHARVIKLLLARDALVGVADHKTQTALHYAVRGQHSETVSLLVDVVRGKPEVDAVAGTAEWTPLFYAVQGGALDIVTLLLDGGASVTRRDDSNNSTLHVAARSAKCTKALVQLLERTGCGVDVLNKMKETPLHAASHHGHLDTARELIALGANHYAKNERGKTPLVLAREGGKVPADMLPQWTTLFREAGSMHMTAMR